ncbi:MAG: protein arginine kinase [Chthoniobacteraceae bacterium]
MAIHNLLTNTGEWLRGDGPHSQIVVSSRVRLARNVRNFSFPGWAKKSERLQILETVKPAVDSLPEMSDAFSVFSQDLTALEKQVLVERHLISREHAAKGVGSAVIMNKKQTLSIMINEEDHLRMQGIRSGLQLKTVFKLIDKVDSELEEKLDFAFHHELGYLTACPTNVGTGMRASAMVHLPALVLSEQINQIIQAVNKIGLAVRGLYGEGTEALGNLFQVSNQTTLGEKEEEIIERLNKVILQIIEHEQNARQMLLQKKPAALLDHIGRGYGILRHAYSMASKEALNLLSFMKLGIDLSFFPEECRRPIDELFMETQPAHLQKGSPRKLAADERDALRAEIVRDKLKDFPPPDVAIAGKKPENGNGE